MPAEAEPELTRAPIPALWTGVLAGPIAALTVLEVNFILVPWACAGNIRWPLFLVALFGLVIAGGGAAIAAWCWRETGRGWPGEEAGIRHPRRFMAAGGVLLSVFGCLAIIAQTIATVILGPCQ